MTSGPRPQPPTAGFLVSKQPWMADAVCLGSSGELFFEACEQRKVAERRAALKEVRSICGACPVAQQCIEQCMLEEGKAPHGRYGVRAGLTPDQRTAIHESGGLRGRNPLRLWKTKLATGGSRA